MYKIQWKVTDDDRERLCSLGKLAGEECYKSITNVLEKEKFTLEDLTEIKVIYIFLIVILILKVNILRKKTEKLRLQQEAQAYRKIIESVDPSQRYGKVDHMENFGVELKAVCGDSYGRVFAYDWAEIVKRSEVSPKTVFNFGVFDGVSLSIAGPHEINGMLYCTEKERLFVGGAGDNIVREYDINQPNKPLRLFSGHSQSVCELASAARESLLSSSADGTVRVWDIRNKTVSRPSFGRCVSALAVDSSFMVCGGGVELGIWHLGSYALAGKMESANVRHLTCEMKADKILTGSMQNKLSQWNYSAEKISDVQGKTKSIYSILHTDTMSFAAGDSHLIDAYINLGYVSFSLNAFPNE
uniref:WD_REPEATS_REGION domain-containing protein n=1 Tax=Heterorhabditis bacteriophora TaxID=37862 RepID=A0A1I7XTB9_HETBA